MTSRRVDSSQSVSVSVSLREAGYVPLPRLWVKSEDMPKIHEIAYAHQEAVTQIRLGHNKQQEKDAAWTAYKKTAAPL